MNRTTMALATVLAGLLAAAVPGVAQGAPRVGRWTGTSAHGVSVSFTIHSVGGKRRYIANEVAMCVAAGDANPLMDIPGSRSYGWPVDAHGRIRDLKEEPVAARSPFKGRLGRTSGTIHGQFGISSSDGSCAGSADPPDQAVAVHWVSAQVAESGRWELSGDRGSYGSFWVIGGAATHEFSGVIDVPAPGTFAGSCIGGLAVYRDGWIQPDGSFAADRGARQPGGLAGRFDGANASGSYSFGIDGVPECDLSQFAFTARLVEPQPRPRVGRLLLPSTPVLPVPPAPVDYVALGDSYSAGEGVPPFDPGTDVADNDCHRSANAYSRLLTLPRYQFNRSFFACSGAVSANVGRLDPASGQIVGAVQHPSESVVQLARLSPAQWSATDMVTLTIGGNDAGFGPVLLQCLVVPCHRGPLAGRITRRIARDVRFNLAATYVAIRNTAPNATVFVLGYPQLFPERPRPFCPIGKHPLSRAKQVFLRQRGAQLNAVIRDEAARAGFHFVAAERAFRGHEPCGPKSEWIHAITLRGTTGSASHFSFHPNRAGQAAYARTLKTYILCLAANHWRFLPSGMPENPHGRRVPAACS